MRQANALRSCFHQLSCCAGAWNRAGVQLALTSQ